YPCRTAHTSFRMAKSFSKVRGKTCCEATPFARPISEARIERQAINIGSEIAGNCTHTKEPLMKASNAHAIVAAAAFALCFSAEVTPAAEYQLATNLPLTGAWANYGVGMQNSFQLAIDQANASGTLGAIKISVIAGDDAGSATQTVNLATKAGA